MVRGGFWGALQRRQASAYRYQQTWKQIPAKALRAGAHTVLLRRTKQAPGLSTWLASLIARKRKQVATVALANKMARMVWAVLFKGEAYRPLLVPQLDAA